MPNHIAIHVVNLQPLKENQIYVIQLLKVLWEMRVDNPSPKEKNKGKPQMRK